MNFLNQFTSHLDVLKFTLDNLKETSNECSITYNIMLFLVPIFGIIFGCSLLFSVFHWSHKQRMEMIKLGIYKKEPINLERYALLLGILLSFIGIVLTSSFFWVLGKSLAILGGLIPFSVGLSFLVYYKVKRNEK